MSSFYLSVLARLKAGPSSLGLEMRLHLGLTCEIEIWSKAMQLYTHINECSLIKMLMYQTHSVETTSKQNFVLQSIANKVVRDLCVHYSFGGRMWGTTRQEVSHYSVCQSIKPYPWLVDCHLATMQYGKCC